MMMVLAAKALLLNEGIMIGEGQLRAGLVRSCCLHSRSEVNLRGKSKFCAVIDGKRDVEVIVDVLCFVLGDEEQRQNLLSWPREQLLACAAAVLSEGALGDSHTEMLKRVLHTAC